MTKEYWDKKHTGTFDGDWASKASQFAEYAVSFFPKTGKILEIGTGKGGDANFFQSLGYEVIATDFSHEALKKARTDFPNVQFVDVDTAQGLPFPDESFDVVYCQMALHYFDQQTTVKIFKDIYRVLKSNGIFATMTNTMDDPEKEENDYKELEPAFYKNTTKGIVKRYFSMEDMEKFTRGLFDTIVLDNQGEVYYKDIKTLVRFIGRKRIDRGLASI